MGQPRLTKDPYNLIITGVGGQGNVMASRVLGNMLVREGLAVTIGETFGSSQRGGSVMSHMRISKKGNWSPQIPRGQADLIMALEPSEAVRLLASYGNPRVKVLSNNRPIYPVDVIAGEAKYPSIEEIVQPVKELSSEAWFIPATDEALKMGNPIYSNIIMLGALAAMDALPMETEVFKQVISEFLSEDKLAMNLKAYELGGELLRQA